MSSSAIIKITIGLAVLLIIITSITFGDREQTGQANRESEVEPVGSNQIPTFTLQNFRGEGISSTDFAGKVLVVNSWASWCPFCVNELPAFGELQELFPDDVAVVAINRAEPARTATDYASRFGLEDTLVFLLDPDDSFYKSIGGFAMPETLFVDRNGDIQLHKRGPLELAEMQEIVESIL